DAVDNTKLADNAVNTENITDGTIVAADIANDAVALEKLANGTATGQVMQWDGTDWILIDLGSVTVTENDGIIGNEVVGSSNGTLTLSGAGSIGDPLRLAVSDDGITSNEIAPGAVETTDLSDDAVTLGKLASGSNTGDLIQWNGTDWEFVTASSLDTDTQYTAGTGLNLVGTEFSADPSLATDTELSDAITASEALDLDKVIGNETITGLAFDGAVLTISEGGNTDRTINISSLDTDTQYTAGTGLNLVGTEFSADPSLATD
ncbi:hypothetical protein, partial [Maribacter caenipelagi]|uniref:hypothetical protein n=1 Tax=Maribacter caenipelagi TaxID=1447781 RepID=UPI001AAF06CB